MHKWLNERVTVSFSADFRAIGWTEHGMLKAVVGYTDVNGKTAQIHVAAEGKYWMRREFLWYTFYYPFIQLDLTWLIGVVNANNDTALKMDTNIGFEEFARIPDGYADGEDLVMLRLHRGSPRVQRWLSLGERYGKSITTRTA
jgi:hypothetical protein